MARLSRSAFSRRSIKFTNGSHLIPFDLSIKLLPLPPEYALNERTHNYYGLLENLKLHKVKKAGDINAILKLSDYGRKGTEVWRMFAKTHWGKIEAPGKYIIKVLRNG